MTTILLPCPQRDNGELQRRAEQGRQVVVCNGYLPKRTITTGVGEVEIQMPKVRDRNGSEIKFTSRLLPLYLKRARSVEELLPWLYLTQK